MKIVSYSVCGPIDRVSKQHAIYGHYSENKMIPLVYLQRPKWIKDDTAWQAIVGSIQLLLPSGTDIR